VICTCSPYDAKNPFLAPITVHRELHKGGDRSCMHIEFDLSGSKIRYDAGDHLAIYPVNDTALVEKLGEVLGVDLGISFTLTNVDGKGTFSSLPFPLSLQYDLIKLCAPEINCCKCRLKVFCSKSSSDTY
jgi:NADPH-ferrihemoprotein reductase